MPHIIVGLWLIISLLIGILGYVRGTDTVLPGPSSQHSIMRHEGERLAAAAGISPTDSLIVILRHPKLVVESTPYPKAIDDLVATLRALQRSDRETPLFSSIRTFGHTAMLNDRNIFVSEDGRGVLLHAASTIPPYHSPEEFRNIPEALAKWNNSWPDFSIGYLSEGTADQEIFALINSDLDHSLLYTLPLTLVILIWAFRSLVVALLPLIIASVSLISSLGIMAFISHTIAPVSATAAQLVVLLVLAIGVDYALFMISRLREELTLGREYQEAVTRAWSTTGIAIIWSGVTVACSLFGLVLMNDTILTSMAHVSILAVCITVLSTVTVLPSLLRLLEKKFVQQTHKSATARPLVLFSVRRPILGIAFAATILLAASFPIFQLRLGSTMERDILPTAMQSSHAYRMLKTNFPERAGTSFSLILHTSDGSPLPEEEMELFFEELVEKHPVFGPLEVRTSEDSSLARYTFFVEGNGNAPANQKIVHTLRERAIPKYLSPLGVSGHVTGILPFVTDETERYQERTPLVFLSVLTLSFLFLLVAFRSIAVAIKAVLLNALSAAAAFGLLVAFFQLGVLGVWQYGVIESFVPALLFSILFGLSMDYHVFLLSRIQEETLRGHDTAEAVRLGIETTYRTISSAALIMISVFAVVACLELPIMKQLGLGLAVAVFLDATIIRTVLLPASMTLLREWNWYLPSWLQWLPKFQLEGKTDKTAAAPNYPSSRESAKDGC